MNKILIDTNQYNLVITKNASYSLEIIKDTNLYIKVLEDVEVDMTCLIQNSHVKICIDLLTNASLLVNQLALNSSLDLDFTLKKNSNLEYIASLITNIDSINKINITHENEFSNSKLVVNGVNVLNNKLYITINGTILKKSISSNLEENSQIINLKDGDSKIIPNLFINNHDVIANHSAFIGNFKDEDCYYLRSRGLNKDQVDNLLLKATLLNGMKLKYDKTKFIYVIKNNKWR